jgi:hypothetical protein
MSASCPVSYPVTISHLHCSEIGALNFTPPVRLHDALFRHKVTQCLQFDGAVVGLQIGNYLLLNSELSVLELSPLRQY